MPLYYERRTSLNGSTVRCCPHRFGNRCIPLMKRNTLHYVKILWTLPGSTGISTVWKGDGDLGGFQLPEQEFKPLSPESLVACRPLRSMRLPATGTMITRGLIPLYFDVHGRQTQNYMIINPSRRLRTVPGGHQQVLMYWPSIYHLKRTKKKLQNMKPLPKVFLHKSHELSKDKRTANSGKNRQEVSSRKFSQCVSNAISLPCAL